MRTSIALLLILMPAFLFSQPAQWRGPDRSGIYPDTGLIQIWPDQGPELLMKVNDIGDGYSSAVESNGIIYVTGKKDTLDYLSAIENSGRVLWQVPYGRSWTRTRADSRGTPTVEGDRVYVVSGTGRLACIHATTGTEIWGVDVDRQYEAAYHLFGLAESPLIVDDIIVSLPGGKNTTMVAFNKYNGEPVWQSGSIDGRRSYTSPMLYEYGEIRLILGFTSKDLIAVDPVNGEIIWTYPYYLKSVESIADSIGINITNTPLIRDNEILSPQAVIFLPSCSKYLKTGDLSGRNG